MGVCERLYEFGEGCCWVCRGAVICLNNQHNVFIHFQTSGSLLSGIHTYVFEI